MDYCQCIQNVINQIEHKICCDELCKEEDWDQMIAQSFYSRTHFYRIFGAMVGMPVYEYIRKRRLSLAATALCTTDRKVIDIALSSGYESQETFTRAFKREYGITPGRFRRSSEGLVLYEKADIETIINRNQSQLADIQIEILVSPKRYMIGMDRLVNPGSKGIRELWDDFLEIQKRIPSINGEDIFGICEYAPDIKEEDAFHYMVAMEVSKNDYAAKLLGLETKKLPPCRYVRIIHEKPVSELKDTYQLFYAGWLPESGLTLAEQDTIEVYHNHSSVIEIWIPVR